MSEYTIDIEKLADKKIESIVRYVHELSSMSELIDKLMLIKFSIQSTNKQLSDGKVTFDILNEKWKLLSDGIEKLNKNSEINEVREFIKSIVKNETFILDKLDGLEKFNSIEFSLLEYIKYSLFNIRYEDSVDVINDVISSIKDNILSTVGWEKMKNLPYIMSILNGKLDIDSLIINLSTIFKGLLNSYLSNVTDKDKCTLYDVMKVNEKLAKVMNENFTERESGLLGIGKIKSSSIIKVIAIEV